MRIRIEGEENGKPKKYEYSLFDKTDLKTDTLSMARTTGYTCTAAANLIANNKFTRKGICPPEYIGEDSENFEFIVGYLKERGVHYRIS